MSNSHLSSLKALPLLESLINPCVFELLDEWERNFIAGLVKLFTFGKNVELMTLSSKQSGRLIECYYKYIVFSKLPSRYQTRKCSEDYTI